jgi:hypothetical protein
MLRIELRILIEASFRSWTNLPQLGAGIELNLPNSWLLSFMLIKAQLREHPIAPCTTISSMRAIGSAGRQTESPT